MLKIGSIGIKSVYVGGQKIKKAYVGEELVFDSVPASRLPEGYTEVEYIKSTIPAYIDTGIKPTSAIKFTIDFEPLTAGSSTLKYVISSYYTPSTTAGTTRYYFYLVWNSSGLRVATGSGTSGSYKVLNSSTTVKRMVVTLDYPNKQAFIEGGTKVSLSNIDVSASMYTIRILRGTTNTYAMDAKIYSCKIENAGNAVRDFVPCINPSGKAGLYDLVTNTFYENANSTGSFASGPVV